MFVKYNAVCRGIGSHSSFLRGALVRLCCSPAVRDAYHRVPGEAAREAEGEGVSNGAGGTLSWEEAVAQVNRYTVR